MALSYCWGERKHDLVIIIDQCVFRISKNLHAALENIRRRHSTRLMIWIDALCINQADIQEKNAQVSIMRSIYTKSMHTYIWLGPNDAWTGLTFEQIKMRAAWERNRKTGETEIGWWEWKRTYSGPGGEEEGRPGGGHRAGRMLLTRRMAKVAFLSTPAHMSIFVRPWFARCWILQETATSRAMTILCGRYHLAWEDLEAVCDVPGSHFTELGTLIAIRRDFQGGSADTPRRLADLLRRTNTRQATDPRDRVFSLLGLVNDQEDTEAATGRDGVLGLRPSIREGLRVDYGASVRDIYIDVTLQCMIRTGHLGILSASLGQFRTELKGFPTWAINPEPLRVESPCENSFVWAIPDAESGALEGRQAAGWAAAGSSKCEPEYDEQNGLLGLQGMFVDAIETVGLERGDINNNYIGTHSASGLNLRAMLEHLRMGAANLKCYFQWRALAGVVGAREDLYRAGGGGGGGGGTMTTEQAFLEIMCPRPPAAAGGGEDLAAAEKHWQLAREFDRFVTSTFVFLEQGAHARPHAALRKRELARIIGRGVQIVWQVSSGKRKDASAAADFESEDRYSIGKRFLRTREGYIGLGGRHAAVGDKVVLLAGSAAPMLLRPQSCQPGRFEVICDAYFVQMMKGELWDPAMCETIWLA